MEKSTEGKNEKRQRKQGLLFIPLTAAEFSGITRRQVDYWTNIGLVKPAYTRPRGKKETRLYDLKNLFELSILRALLEAGITTQALRKFVAGNDDGGEVIDEVIVTSSKSGGVKLDLSAIVEAYNNNDLPWLPIMTQDGLIKIDLNGITSELSKRIDDRLEEYRKERGESYQPTMM